MRDCLDILKGCLSGNIVIQHTYIKLLIKIFKCKKKKEMECSLIATYTVLTTIILEHISPPNGFVRRYNYLTLQIKKLGLRDEVAPSSTACK